MKTKSISRRKNWQECWEFQKAKRTKMIRKINLELEKKGFITVKGKVSKYYIEQHWYGFAG